MDDIDLEDDIRNVVTQEAAIIVDVLCLQRDNVLGRIYGLVERNTRERLEHLPNRRDSVLGILDYFKTSERNRCLHFLKTMWMFCENIPLELEIKVLSIAGWSFGMTTIHFADSEELPPSPSAKRACLDHVQIYTSYMRSFLQQKFERVTKDMAKKVCLDTMYLSLRQRGAARPRAQEGQEPGPDQRESAEWLLSTTGRVVVVLGLAGSGKTLLMHCLSHRWAEGLYPDIQLLFLLEFRQLNLVSQPLSLKELLFQFFLPPEGGEEQSEAVFSYILDNPQKVCFIFDGYDELGAKFTDPMTLGSTLDPCQRLPMADLLSGLCSYKILPGCTVLITCRPRDVSDLFGSSSCFVAELLGFSQQQVREYTEEFFQEKGDALKEKALSRMMGSRHLLSMSHVPALCHVCCVCLDHLLSGEVSQPAAQLPSSLTQIYLHILSAFLSHCEGSGSSLAATYLLQKYRTQIAELCKLAMDGLETSRIVFQAQDLSPQLMNFGANARILSRVDLTCPDGSRSLGCAFMHLTMQEFLAALHLMTSPDVSELKLKKKLNLKSRWIAKSDPRTVFTDSLHLYMCGLAAEACTSSLVVLEGGEEVRGVVQRRQAAVRRILLGFVGSASQTGPKIVELCRCAHETQDVNLAAAIGSRARFELRNIRLNPVDMDALAFVTSAASQMVCLDFGGCSIELECLNIIPNIKNLEHLIFRSRKYDDNFAEALSISHYCCCRVGRRVVHCGVYTAVLFTVLSVEVSPMLDVSDNSLSDESIRKITYLFPKLTNITSVMLGKNNISRDGIFILVEKMATFLNIKKVHVIFLSSSSDHVFFFPSAFHRCSLISISVLCCSLSHGTMKYESIEKLLDSLPHMTSLHMLNLSHIQMSKDIALLFMRSLAKCQRITAVNLRPCGDAFIMFLQAKAQAATCKLTQYELNRFDVVKLSEILEDCQHLADLDTNAAMESDRHAAVPCVVYLANSLSTCDKVAVVEVRIEEPWIKKEAAVSLVASCLDLNPRTGEIRVEKTLPELQLLNLYKCEYFLVDCDVEGRHLSLLQAPIQRTSSLLTLQFTRLTVGREGAEFLASILPSLTSLRKCCHLLVMCRNCSLSLSHHVISDDAATALGGVLEGLTRVRSLNLSYCSGWTSAGGRVLVRGLVQCLSLEEIWLDSIQLDEESTVCLAQGLQNMTSIKKISISKMVLGSKGSSEVLSVLACLHSCTGLQEIDLQGLRIDDQGIEELVKCIPKWTKLSKINLSENCVRDQAGEKLVEALSHCRELQQLRLSRNKLGTSSAARLGRVLPSLPDGCLGGGRVGGCLLHSLTSVGTSDLGPVAACLQHCTSIEDISLAWNECGNEVVQKLVEVLPQCINLRRLDLEANNINTSGAKTLATCLLSCPWIEVIRLWRNPIVKDDHILRDRRLNFSST
uniref:NACHT domain-containing protein n=1 Tax=Electrophorus electricus TaxID=8005 RepID=A0AAY5E8L2_ELEEL